MECADKLNANTCITHSDSDSAQEILLSVVMAVYNDPAAYLIEALESLLAQTRNPDEIVIVDDSTEATTIEALNVFTNRNPQVVKLIRGQIRLGFVNALNQGIQQARGQYIARMDGDDLAIPTRFERQLAFLESNNAIDFVGSDIEIIDAAARVRSIRRYKKTHDAIVKMSLFRNPMAHPSVMMRRNVFYKVGLYDPGFRHSEDYEFWLRAISYGLKFANINEALLRYRIKAEYNSARFRGNWGYNLRAKFRHFNYRYPLRAVSGMLINAIMYLIPGAIMKEIYRKDSEDSIICL